MLWTVYCVDKPNITEVREKHRQSHRDYLDGQKGVILLAGALLSNDGAQGVGSLFVLNVNSHDQAKAFSDGDPFTQAGVFEQITIRRMRKGPWNPQLADGA